MLKLEVIGNLGADAERVQENQRIFVKFRVAHTEKFTSSDGQITSSTVWVSCFWTNSGGNLLQYLKKGTKVFVRGYMSVNIFDSAVKHCKDVGITVNVCEIELCGGAKKEENKIDYAEVF